MILLSMILFWFYGCRRQVVNNEQITLWEKTQQSSYAGDCYQFSNAIISGTVAFGSGGHISQNKPGVVKLSISCNNKKFLGNVRITLPGHDGEGVIYQSAIIARKGLPGECILEVPALGQPSCFYFEIFDAMENVVLSQVIVPDWVDQSQEMDKNDSRICFVGVLTDHEKSLSYLDGIKVGTSEDMTIIRTVFFDEETFPDDERLLKTLSGILVDGFDTSRLKTGQKNALAQFVEKDAGCLMLGTGIGADTVLSGIKNWAGTRCVGQSKEDIRLIGKENAQDIHEIDMADFRGTGKENWQEFFSTEPSSVQRSQKGKGEILLYRISFMDIKESSKRKIAASLLEPFAVYDRQEDNTLNMVNWAVESALYSFLETVRPDTGFYGTFFIIYIACIALIAYYVLRRYRKREYIWFVMPVLSILFTIFMGIHSFGTVGEDDTSLSEFRLVDTGEEEDVVCLLYQNMEGGEKNLKLSSRASCVEPLDYEYRYTVSEKDRVIISGQTLTVHRSGRGLDVNIDAPVPGNSWTLRMKQGREGSMDDGFLFGTDLVSTGGGFYGKITNLTIRDFEKIVVVRGNQYALLPSLDAGETIKVNEEDVYCWDNNQNGETEFLSEDDSPVLSSIYNLIVQKYFKGTNGEDRCVVIGIDTKENESVFIDSHKDKNYLNLYADYYSMPESEKYSYISDINTYCLKESDLAAPLFQDTLEENRTVAVYQFDPEKTPQTLVRNRDQFHGTIYAYNYETGDNDLILEQMDDVVKKENLNSYISDDNLMTLTYQLNGKKQQGSAPVLSLIMDEKNGSKGGADD